MVSDCVMTDNQYRTFCVSEEQVGDRFDRVLSLQFPDISRSRFKQLIKAGTASINNAPVADPSRLLADGDIIAIAIPEPEPAIPQAEPIPLSIIYEDDALIVIDKPSGLVVHPAAGHWTGTLVNALIAHCGDSLSGIGGVRRPGIVHRLDKETSGLLVVAKHDQAHKGLSEQFAAHGRDGRLQRAYVALVWGTPARPQGTVDTHLDRKATNRQKMAVVKSGGKHAITHYSLLESFTNGEGRFILSQIECRLETGRTHQIRVHMAHVGHPVLGDATYGSGYAASARNLPEDAQKALQTLKRQALHAAQLGFEHPITGKAMTFRSNPPGDYQRLLETCRKGLRSQKA